MIQKFLLSRFSGYLSLVMIAALLGGFLYVRHLWEVNGDLEDERDAQAALYSSCDLQQFLTNQVTYDFQTGLDNRDAGLADMRWLFSHQDREAEDRAAGRRDEAGDDAELCRAGDMFEREEEAIYRDAEEIRLQLIACQQWARGIEGDN